MNESGEGGGEGRRAEIEKKVNNLEAALGLENTQFLGTLSRAMDEVEADPEGNLTRIEAKDEADREMGKKAPMHPEVARILRKVEQELRTINGLPTKEGINQDLEDIHEFLENEDTGEQLEYESFLAGEFHPQETLLEARRVPVSHRTTALVLLSLADIPDSFKNRLRTDANADPTLEEISAIYGSISEKISADTETARFEDLALIVQKELEEITKVCEKHNLLENPERHFDNRYLMHYNLLSKSEKGLRLLTSDKKSDRKKVTATSEEGRGLTAYLQEKRDMFEAAEKTAPEDTGKIMAHAGAAYFGSLYDRMP